MENDDVIDTLNKLVENCKDGEYGFQTSAEYLRSPDIQQSFMSRAQQCRVAASELQTLIKELGGTPLAGGTVAGAVHRGWVAVKGALAGYSDKAILEEAERGEDAALARYREALEQALPPSVRLVVERQFEGVKRNHAQVRSLRDQARLAAHA